MSNQIPPVSLPTVRVAEKRADLLDRHLQLDPLTGLDRTDVVSRVRTEGVKSLGEAIQDVQGQFDERARKAKPFQKAGVGFLVVGSGIAAGSWLAGAIVGGLRYGWIGGIGGALAGALGGVLVGMGMGKLGDVINKIGKPPKEEEIASLQRLREVEQHLAQEPARSPEQVEAARKAAEEALKKAKPAPANPEDRPQTDTINGALFGARELRTDGGFQLPGRVQVGQRLTAGGGVAVFDPEAKRMSVVDPAKGTEVWGLDLGMELAGQPAVSSDGTRIAMGGYRGVALVDAKTGTELGRWESGQGGSLNPEFDRHGRLILSSWGDGVACLEPGRKDPVWVAKASSSERAVTSPSDGMIYRQGWSGPTDAINGDSGQKAWSGPVGAELRGRAAVAPDGTLVGGDAEGYVTAVDPDFGLRTWRAKPSHGSPEETVVTADGRGAVVMHDHNRLTCYDVSTGAQRWTARLEGSRTAGPVVAPTGDLLLADDSGRIYRFDTDRGVALRAGKLEQRVSGLVGLPDGDVLTVDDKGKVTRLTDREEPKKDPGKISEEEEFVIIGGIKVPVRK